MIVAGYENSVLIPHNGGAHRAPARNGADEGQPRARSSGARSRPEGCKNPRPPAP